ncbi:hypothetical protein DOY81_010991 [Sarcophaga bullata]|nr:hypothetical protein DOY81_010991 [Sarcophaga bullata]
MRSFFKVQNSDDVYNAPPDTYKMFGTLKSTNASNTSSTDKEEIKKTYRVNQTPVFGRKQSQTITMESYKPHSDSLENLDKIGGLTTYSSNSSSKLDKKELSPPKRAKLPKERTFKSYITSLEVQPAESITEQLPLPAKKENMSSSSSSSVSSKLKVSSNLLGLRKTLNFSSSTRNDNETKSFSRRTLSPTKSSEAKRVVKQEIPTTSRTRNVTTSPTKPPLTTSTSNTTRLTILSPEKIHRLNAKLNDQKKSLKSSPTVAIANASLNSNKTNTSTTTTTTNELKSLQNSNNLSTTTTTTTTTPQHSIRGATSTENERTKRNATSRSQFYTRY